MAKKQPSASMGSDNGEPGRLPRRVLSSGCATRTRLVSLGAVVCAILACAAAPDAALHLLAVWLFLLDGVWGTTTANMLSAKQWSFAASRCHSEMPIASWVRGCLESRLAASAPLRQADPVAERPADDACSNAFGGDDWHTPWVVRSARHMGTNMSAEWISVHHDRRLFNATAVNMSGYSADWESIADCPAKRKQFHKEHPISDLLANQSALYAAFDEGFLDANQKQFRELRSHMLALRNFCDFQGWGGEAFFGFGNAYPSEHSRPFTVGTPFHAAIFSNMFLQVHGERTWTLIAPWYSQYMRPIHGAQYINGAGVYENWRLPARRPHVSRLPRLTVTLKPGDVLYIPSWWWHEVVLEAEGFSLGTSTRGMGMRGKWYRWPVLRFIPFMNGGPWSADRLALDLVHSAVYVRSVVLHLFGSTGSWGSMPAGLVESAQHDSGTA